MPAPALHERLDDRQPEARSGRVLARAAPPEPLEHGLLLAGGDARAVVEDREVRLVALAAELDRDRAPRVRVMQRVLDQVVEDDREVLLGRVGDDVLARLEP